MYKTTFIGIFMENFKSHNPSSEESGVSIYSRSISLLDDDPLDEIFALNLGDFLTEHLINDELAHKIGDRVRDKNESLKDQLRELVSIYSIDNTLSLLGFTNDEDYVIYNSIAKTIKLMLSLEECNIYLCKKGEPLALRGNSQDKIENTQIPDYIQTCHTQEKDMVFERDGKQISVFPMKNKFECIGAIEIVRDATKPIEEQFSQLIRITAGLFVTSLGIQKLIDEVKRLLSQDVVSTSELQNLRAQLTAIIGDLGDKQQAFVEKMAYAVDCKSKYNSSHSKHTAELSREICNYLELNEKTTDLIYYAGLLQNIGKITLSEELFNKKEHLTQEEWQKLQDHPNAGVGLLMNINFLSEVVPYIHYQRERWNGQGAPEGLGGHSIPFGSRIIAVADAYCALIEDRPQRKAMSVDQALEVLKSESGIKWDPVIVEALVELKK